VHYHGALGNPSDRYLGDDPEAIKADIVDGLVALADEEFDAMLFAHAMPVASGGKDGVARVPDVTALNADQDP